MNNKDCMDNRNNLEGFNVEKLKDIAEIIMGQSPPSDTYNKDKIGLPFFQGKAEFGVIFPQVKIYCSNPQKVANINDILMSVRAPVGSVNIADTECCIGRGLCAIRGNDNLDYMYLYYFLKTNEVRISSKGTGSTFTAIDKKNIQELKIPVPPISEQRKIVNKFNKQIAQIEIMKKEAEKQLHAVVDILESTLSYCLDENNIQKVNNVNFSDICSLDKKQIYPKSEEARRLKYLGMEDIESNTGKINVNETIGWDSISSNTFYFNQNHVLYGKLRPYLNKVAEPHFEGRCSTELVPILPNSSCKRDYLVMLLRSSQTIQAAMKNKTGSRMPRADMNEIMKLRVKLPDVSEQEIILQKMKLFTSQLDEIRSTINIQLNAINQLPASILNEVFGQYQINS